MGIFQYNPCTDLSVEWEVVEYHGTDEGDLTGLEEQVLLLIYCFSDWLYFLIRKPCTCSLQNHTPHFTKYKRKRNLGKK
jgi:hypothetical protein